MPIRPGRVSALIGRLTSDYGPEQNLAKPHGLISHIAKAHVLPCPIFAVRVAGHAA